MRILRFLVDAQTITADPTCDFSNIVQGTEGYLRAEFSFSGEWDGCKKAAGFYKLGDEFAAPLVDNACDIPAEALTWTDFSVLAAGERDGYKIMTNKIKVKQEGTA